MLNNIKQKNIYQSVFYIIIVFLFLLFYFPASTYSLWHDEVLTVSKFASNGVKGVFLAPYEANNHVLYSIILAFLLDIFPFSEVIVRLPAMIFAVCFFVVLFYYAQKYFGAFIGWSVGLVILFDDNIVELCLQARGYTILFLCTVVTLFTCFEWIKRKRKKSMIIFMLFSLIGIWTWMLFAVFVGCLLLYSLCVAEKKEKIKVIILGMILVILSVVPYLPMLKSMYEYYSKNLSLFGDKLSWDTFFMYNLVNCLDGLGIKETNYWGGFIALILCGYGIFSLYKKKKDILNIMCCGYFGFSCMLMIFQINAGARYFFFLDFFVLIFLFYGLQNLWNIDGKAQIGKIIATTCFLMLSVILFAPQNLEIKTSRREYPLEAFKESVEYISKNLDNRKLIICSLRKEGFEFYLGREGIDNYSIIVEEDPEKILQYLQMENKAENLLVVDHAILRDAIFSEEQPAAFYNRQLTRGKIIVYEFEKGELL